MRQIGFLFCCCCCTLKNPQRWWLSWQSSRFQHQKTVARIPTSVTFLLNIVYCIEKTKIKKKRPGVAHLKKECQLLLFLWGGGVSQLIKISFACFKKGISSHLSKTQKPDTIDQFYFVHWALGIKNIPWSNNTISLNPKHTIYAFIVIL